MVAVLPLGLAFHTEYPDGVSNAMNIFVFLDLCIVAGTKASMSCGSGTQIWTPTL